MNKITVIYHRADFDGIFCREIARKFLGGEGVEYIGWDYGDPVPDPTVVSAEQHLYMLDISIDGLMGHPNLIWIDHHKSAIEKYPATIPGYRIDGVAACRLAWQWFDRDRNMIQAAHKPGGARIIDQKLPEKQDFVDRMVTEPLAVRLAGEYDIWDKRDPRAELFQHGLRSQDLSRMWCLLLQDDVEGWVEQLLRQGEAIQYAQTQQNESIIKAYGFTFHWEGLTFLACNHARFNSQLFTAGLRPEHDALFGFNFSGTNGRWRVSLYHAPGREHLDLSLIASKYGGGGHRGACGFQTQQLPFIIPAPCSETWPHVLKFAERMEAKLDQNRHKGNREGWLKAHPWDLVEAMLEETVEVQQCFGETGANQITFNDAEALANECADVANYCMMIADAALSIKSKNGGPTARPT